MSIKLTDAQLMLMSAASRRDDRCFELSKGMHGLAARKLSEKLVAAGLAREVRAKAGSPIWRQDDEAGHSLSLKLTAAGLKAIAVDDEEGCVGSAEPATSSLPMADTRPAMAPDLTTSPPDAGSTGVAPREGSKIAEVIALLQRDQGATLAEIVAATNWLPHTSRAALTGLRKRGYAIERRARAEGLRSYVIVATATQAAA